MHRATRLLRSRTLAVVLVACAGANGRAVRAEEFTWVRPGEAGRALCGPAPAGWQRPEFDDTSWAALTPSGSPERRAPEADGGATRCEALFVRHRFDVGPELSRLASLTLSVRYQDGFVAWLNGVEIARERYGDGAPFAAEAHGPDPQRFFVAAQPGLLRPTGNVLALEVRPARPSRVPLVLAGIGGADALRVVRGPHLLRVLDGEALIAVETDLPCRAEARWGMRGGDVRTTVDDSLGKFHLLRLTGLQPGRTFDYRVTLREPLGTAPAVVEAAFHTPPDAAHPLRFVVMGDVRTGHAVHEQLVRDVVGEDPDLVLMTGDLVDAAGDEAEWQRYFEIEASLLRQVPVYSAAGNHDQGRRSAGLARFLALFGRERQRPWWSFDVAGVHFVLLDSNSYSDREQLGWLRDDLAAARKRKVRAVFACVHQGPWSSALHGDNPLAIRDYVPVLEAGGATIVFAGHDHDYERGRVGQLQYVVSGGGGAELRAPRCGAPGLRRCPPRMRAFANEHHYVLVELRRNSVRICPKRPDGTLLEACPSIPLRR